MSRLLRLVVACMICLALPAIARAQEQIHWAPNLQAAIESASRNNQLVLIHFWAPNCPPCKALERNVFNRPEVADAIHRDFVAVKVNADAMPEVAQRYKVDRWPMDVVVTPAGYPVHSMISPQDPGEYVGALGRLVADRRPGTALANGAPQPAADSLAQRQFQEQPQGPSRFSQFSRESPPDQQFAGAPPAAAPIGSPYANPYAQQPEPTNNYAARPPYEAETQPSDSQSPRQTQNPYVDAAPPQSGPQPAAAAPPAATSNRPPLGLDGYCPVNLVEQTKWIRGNPQFGIIHRGYVYLFTSEAEKQRFWQDPDRYAPILSGNDPVAYAEAGQLVSGSRRHGVFFRNQIFMFSSEENLQRFWSAPQRYADAAYQAMRSSSERR